MPFDMLLDALCDRCWAKEELYGGPLDEFEGLDGSRRFLAREGWRITRHRTLCPRCKELPPMTHPSAPSATASSLSLRIHALEQASAALPDLQARLENMTRERTSMAEQLANWDEAILGVRQKIKESEQAGVLLSQLDHKFEVSLRRPPPTSRAVSTVSVLPNALRAQVRAYVQEHPWSRASQVDQGLNVAAGSSSASLSVLVKQGEFQVVQGQYAEASLTPIPLKELPLSDRARIRIYIAAHPDETAKQILTAIGRDTRSSGQIIRMVQKGEIVRVEGKHRLTEKGLSRLPAVLPVVVVPAAPVVAESPAPRTASQPVQQAPTLADVQARVRNYLRADPEHLFRPKLLARETESPEPLVRLALQALVAEELVYVQSGGWHGSLEGVSEETSEASPATPAEEAPLQDIADVTSSPESADDPEFVEAPAQIVLQVPTPEPEPQETLLAEVSVPEPEPEVAVPEVVSVPQPAVPAPEPEISLPQTPALPQVPVAAPTPDQEFPSDDEDFPDEEEGAGDEQSDEETPESSTETVRRLLPPRLSQDQRQVCELLASYPQGITPRLLASRLNWMQSRTDKVVNVLLKDEILLKIAAEVRLAPKYRGGVPRG